MEPQNKIINNVVQLDLENQNKDWSLVKFLFGSPKLILAELFFILNILLLSCIFFSLSDQALNICSYHQREMGSIVVSCPSLLFWYEDMASFLNSIPFWLFFSIFFAFIPEIVFIAIYAVSFNLLARKKEEVELFVSQNKEKEQKVLKILKLSLFALPFLLVVGIALINWTASSYFQESTTTAQNEREEKYQNTIKDNIDFCPDAPEQIYLTTSNRAGNPTLYFKPGYWKGVGSAYISRENYWNGATEDVNMEFHAEVYSPGIVDFSSSTSLFFDPNLSLGKIQSGDRYDLRVYTLNDNSYSEIERKDEKRIIDHFTFRNGVFAERFVKDGINFTVSSSTMVTKEPCLTVMIK